MKSRCGSMVSTRNGSTAHSGCIFVVSDFAGPAAPAPVRHPSLALGKDASGSWKNWVNLLPAHRAAEPGPSVNVLDHLGCVSSSSAPTPYRSAGLLCDRAGYCARHGSERSGSTGSIRTLDTRPPGRCDAPAPQGQPCHIAWTAGIDSRPCALPLPRHAATAEICNQTAVQP